ncbi:hypothetical protein RhiirB3_435529 [Rhizophagus irregularis]|nr:hypothetical protein RhiirB3_435529 [Rhizophagus irregularis]
MIVAQYALKYQNLPSNILDDIWFFILDGYMATTNHQRYDVIGNLAPQVLFSDAEPALINAISIILPETKHFLYIFHIQQNIYKKLIVLKISFALKVELRVRLGLVA